MYRGLKLRLWSLNEQSGHVQPSIATAAISGCTLEALLVQTEMCFLHNTQRISKSLSVKEKKPSSLRNTGYMLIMFWVF